MQTRFTGSPVKTVSSHSSADTQHSSANCDARSHHCDIFEGGDPVRVFRGEGDDGISEVVRFLTDVITGDGQAETDHRPGLEHFAGQFLL